MEMDICEKYFIPDDLTEEEAIEWAKQQAIIEFEDNGWEFIHIEHYIRLLTYLYGENRESVKYIPFNEEKATSYD